MGREVVLRSRVSRLQLCSVGTPHLHPTLCVRHISGTFIMYPFSYASKDRIFVMFLISKEPNHLSTYPGRNWMCENVKRCQPGYGCMLL